LFRTFCFPYLAKLFGNKIVNFNDFQPEIKSLAN